MASPITSGKQVMKRAADQKKGKTEELGKANPDTKPKASKTYVAAKKSKMKK